MTSASELRRGGGGGGHLHVKKMSKLCCGRGAGSGMLYTTTPPPPRQSVLFFTNSNMVTLFSTDLHMKNMSKLPRGGRGHGHLYAIHYHAPAPATKCPLFHKLKYGHPILNRSAYEKHVKASSRGEGARSSVCYTLPRPLPRDKVSSFSQTQIWSPYVNIMRSLTDRSEDHTSE